MESNTGRRNRKAVGNVRKVPLLMSPAVHREGFTIWEGKTNGLGEGKATVVRDWKKGVREVTWLEKVKEGTPKERNDQDKGWGAGKWIVKRSPKMKWLEKKGPEKRSERRGADSGRRKEKGEWTQAFLS